MKRRWLALAAFALAGLVVWLIWPTSSVVITAAREKYARLRLGMSEAEVTAVLGEESERHVRCYGEWVADRARYQWTDLRTGPPNPAERNYDLHSWTFADRDSSGRPLYTLAVQGVFDQGRLVELLCTERRDDTTKKWFRELAARLSIRLSFLDAKVKNENLAVPPS
jgi:hypothetical protein